MLGFLLCEHISLGFRGGMCERRTRARRESEQIFFYPAGIQMLRNSPFGTYSAAEMGNSGWDPPFCFPAASLEKVFSARQAVSSVSDFLGCPEPLSCCHTSTAPT